MIGQAPEHYFVVLSQACYKSFRVADFVVLVYYF